MANQRTTFGKRQREQTRLDKAKAKEARLAARRGNNGAPATKGPPIAWGEAVHAQDSDDETSGSLVPTDDSADNSHSASSAGSAGSAGNARDD